MRFLWERFEETVNERFLGGSSEEVWTWSWCCIIIIISCYDVKIKKSRFLVFGR